MSKPTYYLEDLCDEESEMEVFHSLDDLRGKLGDLWMDDSENGWTYEEAYAMSFGELSDAFEGVGYTLYDEAFNKEANSNDE